jgi:hypothetical protein
LSNDDNNAYLYDILRSVSSTNTYAVGIIILTIVADVYNDNNNNNNIYGTRTCFFLFSPPGEQGFWEFVGRIRRRRRRSVKPLQQVFYYVILFVTLYSSVANPTHHATARGSVFKRFRDGPRFFFLSVVFKTYRAYLYLRVCARIMIIIYWIPLAEIVCCSIHTITSRFI